MIGNKTIGVLKKFNNLYFYFLIYSNYLALYNRYEEMMREVASHFLEVMCTSRTYIYIIQLINLKQKKIFF